MSVQGCTNMPNGGVKQIQDYLLTIDVAKELCMMSYTDKGKEIRKYFIQVEKNWNNPDMIVQRAMAIQQNKIKLLETENKNLNLQLEEANKKASYLDVILGTPDALTITQIAFDYGYGAVKFNQLLKEVGIQHKVHGQWILYRAYVGKSYTTTHLDQWKDREGRPHSKPRTLWTQKGRKLIYDVLKEDGILPLIERDDID
ncbi:MAG: phage antirepressor KilAC domain-containing protein [Lactobacillus sp.]|nr:phage antirepressor KilAC domain-containing protein [Lactobacillus sp.]